MMEKLILVFVLLLSNFQCIYAENEGQDDYVSEYINSYIVADQDIEAPIYYPKIATYSLIPTSYPDNGISDLDAYPSVRNQGSYGTCWSFASLGLAEFDLINDGSVDSTIDLSELQLAYNMYYSVTDPLGGTVGDTSRYDNNAGSTNYLNNGGNFLLSMKRLSQWVSAVNESDVPYNYAPATLISGLDSKYAYTNDVAHLKNAYIISIDDNTDILKEMIMEHGAAGTMYYHDSYYMVWNDDLSAFTYYNNKGGGNSHAIMIVGWDDNFSKDNFLFNQPNSDGAWLIRNSWGSYCDYFWMSYEETTLGESAYVFDFVAVGDEDDYDNNYQLDGGLQTQRISNSTSKIMVANIYTVDNKDDVDYEVLKAIQLSFTRYANVDYKIEVYTNLTDISKPTSGTKALTVEDSTSLAGLTMVDLDEEQFIALQPNTSYSVIITVDDASKLDFEGATSTVVDISASDSTYIWLQKVTNNKTYYSYDGTNYYKSSSTGNLCLKAFTDNVKENIKSSYTLTFNSNGGTVSPTSKSVTYGNTYGTLPTPSRSGYKFNGWYTSASGGTQVTSSTKMGASNATIYAHWTKNSTPTPTPTPSITPGIPNVTETIVMYRVYNPNSGEHFYTSNEGEKNDLVFAGWKYEGLGWIAPKTSKTPVYRLYSGTDHHYTTSSKERDELVKVGWKDEGIGWYSDDSKGVPLYRQYNPNVDPTAQTNNSGSHNYTTSKEENDELVKVGWKAEGIAWYGVKS